MIFIFSEKWEFYQREAFIQSFKVRGENLGREVKVKHIVRGLRFMMKFVKLIFTQSECSAWALNIRKMCNIKNNYILLDLNAKERGTYRSNTPRYDVNSNSSYSCFSAIIFNGLLWMLNCVNVKILVMLLCDKNWEFTQLQILY